MLNEKHNDPPGWKSKLEGLTVLPGETAPGKELAWEKLQGRLQQKPLKRKAIWYWAAAAILLACIIPRMTANKEQDIVVKKDPQQQNIISPALHLRVPPKETVMANEHVEKRKVENRIAKNQHPVKLKITIKKNEPFTVITGTGIEKDPVAITMPAATTDTAATVAVKKKLSVVHINELAPASVGIFSPTYAQTPFKIKFRNGKPAEQKFASQQYASGFKIRLSPKN
ncbi:MAG TPA: hypothetical protein VK489_02520 [Ferruginibacter sp.]|nr:hypothetical protein [Ferruginibacter sp.]